MAGQERRGKISTRIKEGCISNVTFAKPILIKRKRKMTIWFLLYFGSKDFFKRHFLNEFAKGRIE